MRHVTPAGEFLELGIVLAMLTVATAEVLEIRRLQCKRGVDTVLAGWEMKQMTTKVRTIGFRLTDDEYAQIEKAAAASGENVGDWCRRLALSESGQGDAMSRNDRLIYEELARVRYLIGRGFRMLADETLDVEEWETTLATANKKGAQIVNMLLARRDP